ncbi:MAG: protein kinase domain-containing protein [Gemmatimonadaceae bacterium]
MSTELREQLQIALGSTHVVERELGGGGMSRVFVATETAFGRKVVAKVLHPDLAQGVSVERFKREIALVAKLQHPHIVPLLSAGERDGVLYYTMPLIEGESLRERLEREIELPVVDAVRILREIAGALAYAHRHGLVHRDIKPDNVLFSDGTAVVTDFGIAKAITAAKTHGDARGSTLTQLGTSLGTPAYMSPEQVTADPAVDHRADIYALGCVAFELLTGRPPFVGRGAQSLMAAHSNELPEDVVRLRPTTPPALAALVMQCLAKRPADRPQSAEEIGRALSSVVITPAGSLTWPAPQVSPRAGRRAIAIGGGLLLAGVAVGVLVSNVATPPQPEGAVRRFSITLPDSAPMAFIGSALFGNGRRALAIAPDGSSLVYVARVGAATMLYSRRLDESLSRPVSGTTGAFLPFFSPDGKWIAFFSGRELKRIGADGSGLVTLAQVANPIDGAWTERGQILVVEDPETPHFVSESGGRPTPLARFPVSGSTTESALPGTNWLLTGARRRIGIVDLTSGAQRVVTASGVMAVDSLGGVDADGGRAPVFLHGSAPVFARSGHIVYTASAEAGSLVAVPFDAARLRVLGPPSVVLQGIRQERGAQDSPGQYALSREGTLVYVAGANAARVVFVKRSRNGASDTLPLPAADYGAFRLSPSGRHLFFSMWPPNGPIEQYLADLTRKTRLPLALDGAFGQATWWPGGESILSTFGGPRQEVLTVRVSTMTGSIVDTVGSGAAVAAVSPDSSRLLIRRQDLSLWLAPRDNILGGRRVTGPPGWFASFSPNGEWILYTGSVEGRFQVMLARVANPDERYQISRDGGEEGLWSKDGGEVVYRHESRWFGVRVSTRNGISYDAPRMLFEGAYTNVPGWSHDLTPDGGHLLLAGPPEQTTTELQVVTNWFAELRRLAPPGR